MAIDTEKYLGWCLEGISLETDLFALNLARHSLPSAETMNLGSQLMRARIFLTSKKVVLSNVSNGAEISGIKQNSDDQGNIICIFEFGPDSFIEITANGITDLAF